MNKVVIFGASGHGKVIADILEQSDGYRIIGFIDSYKKPGSKVLDYSVLGSEKDLSTIIGTKEIKGIVGIGDNWSREQMVNKILKIQPDFQFVSAIHPGAIVSNHAKIGNGVVIVGGSIVNPGAQIGNHCIINTKSSVGHDSILDNFSSIAPGVTLGGHVSIGKLSAISLGTTVLNNITIGKNSVVGSSTLVNKDIEDDCTAFGIPAKIIGRRKIGDPYL